MTTVVMLLDWTTRCLRCGEVHDDGDQLVTDDYSEMTKQPMKFEPVPQTLQCENCEANLSDHAKRIRNYTVSDSYIDYDD